jgi:hypothetical protein
LRSPPHYLFVGIKNESEAIMNRDKDNGTRRYPVSFALKYVLAGAAADRKGVGETVWMSGREVAFLSKGPAGVSDKVALYIEWPVLLHDEVPLQMIVTAEVVQRSGPLSIAKIARYEFRTRGALSSSLSARQPLPFSTWAALPARIVPALRTVGSAPPSPPPHQQAVALAARG